jgi:hypothetical protein
MNNQGNKYIDGNRSEYTNQDQYNDEQRHRSYGMADSVGKALIGMLATLAITGIISTVSLGIKVATLADASATTVIALNRLIEHSVDREEYLRRDTQIQKAIEGMATKDELRSLKETIDEQSATLKSIEATLNATNPKRR